MEVLHAGSDPCSIDFNGSVVTVAELSGSNTSARVGDWDVWMSEIHSRGLRGGLDYLIHTPEAGVYRIEIVGYTPFLDSARLLGYVDGHYVGQNDLKWDGTQQACHFFTPWLTAGAHALTIYWDNILPLRRFLLFKVRLQEMLGPDSDGDGILNWVESRFDHFASIDSLSVTNLVSPMCLEGNARFTDLMTISDGLTIRHGIGNRWYSNVPLSQTGATQTVLSFESGGRVLTNTTVWAPCNVIKEADLVIRKDDALRFGQPCRMAKPTVP